MEKLIKSESYERKGLSQEVQNKLNSERNEYFEEILEKDNVTISDIDDIRNTENLELFLNNSDYKVRRAIANRHYKLDVLCRDENKMVRAAAIMKIEDKKLLEELAKTENEKFVLTAINTKLFVIK